MKHTIKEEKWMKATVKKDCCIGCGLCEATCPEIFKLGEDGFSHAADQEIPNDLLDSARDAQDSCPMTCITVS